MDSSFSFSLVLATVFFLFIFLLTKTNKSKHNSNLPPGNNGWPILGESLGFARNPGKFIQDRMKIHSPNIFQTKLALEKVVFFCGSSSNDFLYSNETMFKTWLPKSISKALSIIDTDRRTSLNKLFNEQAHKLLRLQSLVDYVPIMDTKTRDHLQHKWIHYKEVKVHPLSKEFTFSLACNLLFKCENDSIRALSEPFLILADRLVSVPINFPGTAYNKALKASKIVQGKLIDMIKKREEELLLSSKVELVDKQDDLLSQVLIISKEEGNSISYKELAGLMIGLLIASFHTTSNAITFVLHHLAEYPDVYAKVLQEQLEIAKSKSKGELLTWKDIQKMKYSWNVVCESMRVIPPGLGGFRETLTDISYSGFTIPKGWKVHWNVYSTHMDPKCFPDPEKFDPSRFEHNLPPRAFVPFGGGLHVCCGREYTRIEILVYLYNVVTRFKISKANPNEKIIFTPDPVSVEGLRILLHPHEE